MRTILRIIFHPVKFLKLKWLDYKLSKELTIPMLNERGILYDYFYKDR